MSESGKRTIYLDALRLIAMIGVVGIHVSAQNFTAVPLLSRAWHAFNLYDGLVRWSVPLFAMVSGALFLDPARPMPTQKLFTKYIPRILLVFFVWSAFYAAQTCAGSVKVFLLQLLKGHYHMWFLFMLMGLYLLVPLLRRITADRAATRYFLLLSLIFTFLVPDVLLLLRYVDRWLTPGLGDASEYIVSVTFFHFTLGFVPYFVLGYALHAAPLSARAARWIYALGALGFAATVALNALYSADTQTASTLFFDYNKICVLLETVSVFVLAKQTLTPDRLSERRQRRIMRLARFSFGFYLAHPFVLQQLERLGLTTVSFNAFLSVPVLVALVSLLALAISVLLHQIPIVRKYLV